MGGWDGHTTGGLPCLPYLPPTLPPTLSLCPQPRRPPARLPCAPSAATHHHHISVSPTFHLLPFSSSLSFNPLEGFIHNPPFSPLTSPRPKVPVANLQHWQVCAGLGRPLLSIGLEEFAFLDLYFLLPSIHCLPLTHTSYISPSHPHLSTWTLDLGRSLGNQNTTSSSPCFCAPSCQSRSLRP